MHWLDTAVLSADGLTATATRNITPDHLFVHDGCLLSSALIELMAQAAAAGSSLKAQSQGRKVRDGVLVSINDFRILGPVPAGSLITLKATHEKTFGALTRAALETRIDARPIATATMTFHLQFE